MSAKRFAKSSASVVCLGWLVSACATDVRPPHAGEDRGDGGIRPAPADATSGGGACSGISQCGFPCPAGTVNPRDQNGCEHTCTCVLVEHASAGPVSLKMYTTCGDPVCGGPRANPGVPMCASSDVEGAVCRIEGIRCDLQNQCNQLLVCAREDPKTQVGGCPISRRSFKSDVHYLDASELARYQQELLTMKLATWRYKHSPARRRLGFIIDDHESSVAVEDPGDRVDLYGYASLAVAALQRQAQQIAALEREVTLLKRALKSKPALRNE